MRQEAELFAEEHSSIILTDFRELWATCFFQNVSFSLNPHLAHSEMPPPLLSEQLLTKILQNGGFENALKYREYLA